MESEFLSNFHFPPGFRFHPSDEELIVHYLFNKVKLRPIPTSVIGEIELYNFNPWELPSSLISLSSSPEKALFGEDEWFFFSPRDRKYLNGTRPNRAAALGFWKATGTDKPIFSSWGVRKIVGVKKALVFCTGHPPGVKTDWIMNEYRLPETTSKSSKLKGSMRLDDCFGNKNMSKNRWEILQESNTPTKINAGGTNFNLPKMIQLQELPSLYTTTKPNDIITDRRFKDFQTKNFQTIMASILAGQDIETIYRESLFLRAKKGNTITNNNNRDGLVYCLGKESNASLKDKINGGSTWKRANHGY